MWLPRDSWFFSFRRSRVTVSTGSSNANEFGKNRQFSPVFLYIARKRVKMCNTVRSDVDESLLEVHTHTHTHTPVERPFVRDYPGEPVPERKNQSGFYWSKRQWVAVASTRPYASLHLQTDTTPAPHRSVFFSFYRPDALPAAQPTASKHWIMCNNKITLSHKMLPTNFCQLLCQKLANFNAVFTIAITATMNFTHLIRLTFSGRRGQATFTLWNLKHQNCIWSLTLLLMLTTKETLKCTKLYWLAWINSEVVELWKRSVFGIGHIKAGSRHSMQVDVSTTHGCRSLSRW